MDLSPESSIFAVRAVVDARLNTMIYPDTFESKVGFDAVRQEIAQCCHSSLGTAAAGKMRFARDFRTVADNLNETAEMLALITSEEAFPLEGLTDTTEQLRRLAVAGSVLTAEEIHRLRSSLQTGVNIASFFRRLRTEETVPYPILDARTASLITFPDIIALIDNVLDRFGEVKDNASPALKEIRDDIRQATGSINGIVRRIIAHCRQEGIVDDDTAAVIRDGRLVVPVPSRDKRRINGIIHDISSTGQTVFIEPAEAVEANNRIRQLQFDEQREIARILATLTDDIRPHADEILSSNDALGHLDFVHAKACYARDVDGRLPVVEQRRELEWYHAVHPGLKASLARQGKEPVPLNITLTSRERILVISGPNAGGKSVCLKTVGLIQYMIQCGVLPTVYENSHIGVFSNIFIDIGDDQSIDNDLSTYSSHLMNMKAFLRYGDRATLILIDEMGSGTEPQIGGAIAQATLQEFNNKKMWGVVTTHYQNLKNFAHDTAGLVNGSMLYDRQAMRPLFQLSIGNPGSSFAIEIARKTGMPSDILAVAEEIVGSEYVSIDRYLLDINRDKKYWENKRAEIKAKEKKLDSLLERYEADADELREKRNAILREAKEEAKGIIEKSNAAIERTIHEIRTAQAERERTLEARRRLAEEHRDIANPDTMPENEILKKAPKPKKKAAKKPTSPTVVAVGAFVRLDGKGTIGKVISIEGKKATVEFGALSTTVAIDRLTPTDDRPTVSAGQAASFVSATTRDNLRQRQLEFRDEIDVRGMRADEAIQAVTYFIDDALQFNVKKVRILHGTGTGALRQSIRQYLRTVAGVEKFHDEHVQFGGAGITVVEL